VSNPAANKIPSTPFLGPDGKTPSVAWQQWLLNPSFNSVQLPPIGVAGTYGATYTTNVITVNTQGQVTAVNPIPISLTLAQIPALGTIATQNSNAVALTGGSITGTTFSGSSVSATTLTASGAFGVNSASAQTPYASGGAVAGTAATNVAPYGYTTAAQANGIVTLLNNIRAALVANGIMS
jgi:hypothetical protein